MTDHHEDRVPHRSPGERESQRKLTELLVNTPIPGHELLDNLSLYVGRKQLMDTLAMSRLYQDIVRLPGVIMEFGVRWGRHLSLLSALRSLYEPYNVHRRIVGFDTFRGFPDVATEDGNGPLVSAGALSVTPAYEHHLDAVLDAHRSVEPLGHVSRTFSVKGDVRETLPEYLSSNQETLVALALFDLDLYESTKAALKAIVPHLISGSILAFDQVGHARWPGETLAIRDVFGLDTIQFETLEGFPSPVFIRWDGRELKS